MKTTSSLTLLIGIFCMLLAIPCSSQFQLYGLTALGGSSNMGTLFSYTTGSGNDNVHVNFNGANGNEPAGGLIKANDGLLYGMTVLGGSSNVGVLFSFNPTNSQFNVLVNFNGTNGSTPWGSLIQHSNGKLYGVAYGGGTNNNGVLFSYDPVTTNYAALFNFDGTNNGSHPQGTLLEASDGLLYGMARDGGLNGDGLLYSYNPISTNFAVLKTFDGANSGRNPQGNHLIQLSNGLLYGTTDYGGSSDNGLLFSYNLNGTYTPLYSFNGTNGGSARGSLFQAPNGKLYGTAWQGGVNGKGVIYSYNPLSSVYNVEFNFDVINGSISTSSFVLGPDGLLYGCAFADGGNGHGVIFSFNTTNGTYTDVMDFTGTVGGSGPDYESLVLYSVTGIAEKPVAEETIAVYPNPSLDGNFTVEWAGNEEGKIRIMDLSGREVMSQLTVGSSPGKKYGFNLSESASGLYLLEAECGDKVIRKKIIIQH
jgi:uncharacterized repeat protein (TIGR03803 family)